MNKKEFESVKKGDKILHKHYGECLVQEIMGGHGDGYFGTIIQPLTDEGKLLLHYHSGAPLGTPLEHSLYQFRPIDRPFNEESKGLVHFRKLIQEAAQRQEEEQKNAS